ncbi:related to nucleotide excision repair protein RAD23 [Rhynchosporium agropyri]|uniref:UV excision repair protein RAD23 n=1 Tax=Rhynchosporium agropyri TaxID=914238 RepID=A0A1E1KNY4_9HELO|nr:related to nucleotide excision repair protein RAD23 [Rhynchosporium agropyri]
MKLTFKDLKQNKFVIEAEPSELISDVKEKISKEKGWEISQQKLIYSGKILQDANTVESYSIEEKGFIVCMVAKPKAAPAVATPSKAAAAPPATPAAPIAASTPAPPQAPAQSSSTNSAIPATPSPAGSGAAPAAIPSTPSGAASGATSGISMGAERASQIAEMESMGFPRTEIDAAMRAAFYNSERAIEYLLNGIPESIQQQQRAPAPAAAQGEAAPVAATVNQGGNSGGEEPVNLFEAAAQAGGRGGSAPAGGARSGGNMFGGGGAAAAAAEGGLGNLDFLRNNPQFQQLRQVVQQQPQMLEPILQQVGAGNPQLAALIGQHPEQFLQLLSEDAGDDAPLPPGAQAISVTEEERAAIERLVTLTGASRDHVIQAYFACDKNEDFAANFLFDTPDDDMEG